jgi:hypothetical protein
MGQTMPAGGDYPVFGPSRLVDFELAKLDVWHYNDDYLQPQQLRNVEAANKKSFLALMDINNKKLVQLADDSIPDIFRTTDGDGDFVLGVTDIGQRIASQWTGNTLKSIFTIDLESGKRNLIKQNIYGAKVVVVVVVGSQGNGGETIGGLIRLAICVSKLASIAATSIEDSSQPHTISNVKSS